ncbi:DUF6684 family protein [Haladaptatus paucihalophilus]|nr:hypothetical protein SAMN05444342_4286 [Haladaptatus paucihalophilus DX253]
MCAWQLNRETVLDLSVNIIPLGILLFFSILFMIVNPWGWDPFPIVLTHFLTLFPFVLLAILSYIAGLKIQSEEQGE